MPTASRPPVKRVTNEHLAAQISGLHDDIAGNASSIAEVKVIAIEARELARRAGLNGFSDDIRAFFEQRSESMVARRWVNRKLSPLLRFKYVIAFVGFLSTLAWAVLAIKQLAATIPHH